MFCERVATYGANARDPLVTSHAERAILHSRPVRRKRGRTDHSEPSSELRLTPAAVSGALNDPDPAGPGSGAFGERISRLSAAILRISASLDLATVLKEVVDSARAPLTPGARRRCRGPRCTTGASISAASYKTDCGDCLAQESNGVSACLSLSISPYPSFGFLRQGLDFG